MSATLERERESIAPEREAARPVHAPSDHPAVAGGRIGIVLMNLGTPDGTDYWSMRRYLGEFLSDRRVIDYSPWLWQPLLQAVILTKRPFTSGRAYRSIWNEELDESPLKTISRAQASKLAARLRARDPRLVVDWAMRYGNPSTRAVIDRLTEAGCRRLLLMALYPQYAAPTTATAYDKAFDALKSVRWQPAVRTLAPYHDHPTYVRLLVESIERHLAGAAFTPDKLVFSYHGMPKRLLLEGDPYYCMCQKTTRLVQQALGWPDDRIMVCFQSRFGPEEWLQPYLDKTLEALPGQGIKKIAVISPAFVTDCLETLEEIAEQGKESFLHHGGEAFTYIPCLNDEDAHIDLLEELALGEMQGWL